MIIRIEDADVAHVMLIYLTCITTDVGMISNGAAGWGFIVEISTLRLRTHTAGFGAACTCVAGVVMNVLTPYMVNANKWNWGFKTGWFYAGVGLQFVIGAWLLLPETSGYVIGAQRNSTEITEIRGRMCPNHVLTILPGAHQPK